MISVEMNENPSTERLANPAGTSLDFLQGGGEMGALMRAHDWSTSSLGSPTTWPQPLRTVVRLMLNTGHPMYIWWGRDGACLYNDAYRESIGPERHPGSLGRPAREVWEEIWPIIGPQVEQVLEGRGATWHVNHLVPITRHGRRDDVYWTYSYSPIDDESAPGGIGGVLVVCTETTQQVQAALQVKAERDQLGQLFEQAPTFMALLSGPNHRFEIANPKYLELVGCRPVLGRTVAEALPDAVEQGYLALLDAVFASGDAYSARGARFVGAAVLGAPVDERFLDFVYQPIKNADGIVTGIFVEGVDVTDRAVADAALRASEVKYRELAEELSTSNRLKDEFLATLAHELRNPLAPISNALAVQRMAPGDGEAMRSTRELMERQLAQMVRLIDDLLDLSRLSRGLVELRRERLSLAGALANAVETSRPLIEQSGHQLTVTLPGEELIVDADATRIVQVFVNLLNNAAKFTPAGGKLELHLSREGRNAVVTVRDNGIGLPPDMLHRVFDMFTQVHRSHARVGGGLGIGLTLVRQLVEQHGGEVEARSAGPGLGSEFLIHLPLAPHGAVAAGTGVAKGSRDRPSTGLRVLVADDNVDAAGSLVMILNLAGHETRTVHDGAQALSVGHEFRPHAMVLDIAMPRMDGHAVCRRLRSEAWGKDLLLIAVSGWGQAEDRQQSRDAGFDHHLVKPIEFEALDRLFRKYLQERGPL
jgi:signal transduction histidine kinase